MTSRRDTGAPVAAPPDVPGGNDDTRRVAGLDLARGLAVLGMFGSHLGADTPDPGAAAGLDAWLLLVGCAVAGATGWRAWLGRGPLERLLTWSSGRAADVSCGPPAR